MQMHPKEKLGRVILTASWFDNINMGYGFHTSTVGHSCCNNVMYNSEENLDRKWQDYVYIQCEYKSTKQKIKHLLREENKVKENKIS